MNNLLKTLILAIFLSISVYITFEIISPTYTYFWEVDLGKSKAWIKINKEDYEFSVKIGSVTKKERNINYMYSFFCLASGLTYFLKMGKKLK